MNTTAKDDPPAPAQVWIIDEGRYGTEPTERFDDVHSVGPVKRYRLSDLGRYMIEPGPVEVTKRLVGCELNPRVERGGSLRRVAGLLPAGLRRRLAPPPPPPQVVIAEGGQGPPALATEDLARHMARLDEALHPFEPTTQQLATADAERLADVVGICEDAGGQRSYLTVQGNVAEKLDYVRDNLNRDVQVILDRAYTPDGLFDLIGFDFQRFETGRSHTLARFHHEGRIRACVLDDDGRVAFWVDDLQLVHYLILFQQSIRSNPRLDESLRRCTEGRALPLKLYFKKQLNILYTGTNLPALYKEIFEKCATPSQARETVLGILKDRQVGVSFNYVPRETAGAPRLFTEVSVLQDCRVLDAVREHVPDVVSEVSRRASVTEAGRYYLLDAMRGFRNEQ